MARLGHQIHDFLLDRVEVPPSGSVLDLGCGSGPTLAAAAKRFPGVRLIGLDASATAVAAAHGLLDASGASIELVEADLDGPLPIEGGSIDAVISHNLLECLIDPGDLLAQAHRVLRTGAPAIWSHTDFDTVLVNTADGELSRRVLHAYADQPQPWMNHHDARMGRKLAALVRASQLDLVRVDAHVVSETEPTPEVRDRLDDVVASLAASAAIEPDELDRWQADVERSVTDGSFFFAEITFVAVSRKA